MLFSEVFGLNLDGSETWFDPILSFDTKLYIDPFLVFQDEFGPFLGAHAEISDFYSTAFEMIAEAGEHKFEPKWSRAVDMLRTPEVSELCLGVTDSGTDGLGSGSGKARLVANGLHRAIMHGLANPKHFETVQLFEKGIAEDTISDAVGNIIRSRLAEYTQAICSELSIPVQTRPHLRGRFDPDRRRWIKIDVTAPINPYSKDGRGQILLCPKQYLRPMPSLNPDDYWGYCYDQSAQQLRTELGEEITRNVKKEVILEKALQDFESVKEFVDFLERVGGTPYDLDRDPKGLIKWYKETQNFVRENPITLLASNDESFEEFIDRICAIFKNYVENQGGWQLIYNDDGRAKSEEACQRLFLGIVKHYCGASNIDLSREVNIGRGPVDFKFSNGYTKRALVELKLASNTKFWSGLKSQLPKYLESEEVKVGRFIVVCFNEADVNRLKNIYERTAELVKDLPYKIKSLVVEAVYKPLSASKLRN